jgi:hypothetical protein
MNLVINSNSARKLPFLGKKLFPTNEVIGPFDTTLKQDPYFRFARDSGLISIVSPVKSTPSITPEDVQPVRGELKEGAVMDEAQDNIPEHEEELPATQDHHDAVPEEVVEEQAVDYSELCGKTISDIKKEVMSGEYDIPAVIEFEKANKNRTTLISFLEQL